MLQNSNTTEVNCLAIYLNSIELISITYIIMHMTNEDLFDDFKQLLRAELGALDNRLSTKIDDVAEKVEGLNDKVDSLTERVDVLTDRVDEMDDKLDTVVEVIGENIQNLKTVQSKQQSRITLLEQSALTA